MGLFFLVSGHPRRLAQDDRRLLPAAFYSAPTSSCPHKKPHRFLLPCPLPYPTLPACTTILGSNPASCLKSLLSAACFRCKFSFFCVETGRRRWRRPRGSREREEGGRKRERDLLFPPPLETASLLPPRGHRQGSTWGQGKGA